MHMTSGVNPFGDITTHAPFQLMKIIQFHQLLVKGTEHN